MPVAPYDSDPALPQNEVRQMSGVSSLGDLSGLSVRESQILRLYFGSDGRLPRTAAQIARGLRIKRRAVLAAKERAIRKLASRRH